MHVPFGHASVEQGMNSRQYGSSPDYQQSYTGDLGPVLKSRLPLVGGQRRTFNFVGICICILMPWVLFCGLYSMFSFTLFYNSPSLCYMLFAVIVIVVVAFGLGSMLKMWRNNEEPTWNIFLFLSCLVACAAGFGSGIYNFSQNMQPYYDVSGMNVYPAVDPANVLGQQIMDSGHMVFTPASHLDLQKSMGFKNKDVYCVAPIAVGNQTLATYDFWAVGINCCSGQGADFACGEYSNPSAHSGLRLMHEDQRPYFRLAVQQAEAAYNIRANHPVFLYWMQDPIAEINAYQDAGFKLFLFGVFSYFAVQLVSVFFTMLAFAQYSD